MSFQRLPILKVNLVEKMKRNTYSDVILLVMHKTLPSFTAFTWFNGKSKMAAKTATLCGDVTGLQRHHHTWNISHLVEKIKGFPLKVKSFQNIATYLGRGSINPVPLPRPWLCYKGLACSKEQATYSKKKTFFARQNSFTYNLGPSFNSAQTKLQTSSSTYWPLGYWRMLKRN